MAVEAGKLIVYLREAGAIERAHTLPHHGSYRVDSHSWGVAMLIFTFHPNPSLRLIKRALTHDVAERWTGDIPAPTKWADGEIAKRLNMAELRIEKTLGLDIELDEDEKLWLKSCDVIELFLWAKDQVAMGNLNANVVLGNLASYFSRNAVPLPLKHFLETHTWTRTPDAFPKAD